jgi:hypothetical protein
MKFVSDSSSLVAAGFGYQRLLLNMENRSVSGTVLNNRGWNPRLSFLTVFHKKIFQCSKDLPMSRNTMKDMALKMKTDIADRPTNGIG